MAATLVDLAGFEWGLASDETGINIETISQKTSSKKVTVPDRQGETRGIVYYDSSIEITITGEITGNNGIAAATVATAITVTNTLINHGVNAGGVYVDEVTE